MYPFLVILLVLTSLALVGVVLLQSGKGDGLSGAFGMGEGQAVFGNRAGDVLTKATSWFAIAFMVLSLAVTYVSKHAGDSMLSGGRTTYSPSGRSAKPTTLAEYEKAGASSGRVDRTNQEREDDSTSAVPASAGVVPATKAVRGTNVPPPATVPATTNR